MKYSLFWILLGMALLLPLEVENRKAAFAQSTVDNATMEEIIGNTDEWVGKTVTVEGTFDELKDNNTFTLENDAYFDSDRLLIINNSGEPLPQLPEENITLRITGKVDKVGSQEYYEGTEVNVPENIADEVGDKLAIYADSIILAPDPVEIVETPSDFYGTKVAVAGKVANVLDDNAFSLKEYSLNSDRNLLVLNLTGEAMPENNAEVLVEGEVRSYDRQQLAQDYGYDTDWTEFFTDEGQEFSDAVVLIVEKISPVDFEPSNVNLDVNE